MERGRTQVVWNEADWNDGMPERFRFMAEEALRRHELPESLAEDWRQEMCLAVAFRLAEYDPARASRKTFMKRAAQWRLQELLREHLRVPLGSVRRPLDSSCLGTDAEADGNAFDPSSFYGGAYDPTPAMDLRLDLASAVARLPERLARTCELLTSNTPREAAEILGKNEDTVYDRIALLRRALAKHGVGPEDAGKREHREAA